MLCISACSQPGSRPFARQPSPLPCQPVSWLALNLPRPAPQARPASCAARYLGISRTNCQTSAAMRLFPKTDRAAATVWRLRLVSAGMPRVARATVVPTNILQVELAAAPGPSESP